MPTTDVADRLSANVGAHWVGVLTYDFDTNFSSQQRVHEERNALFPVVNGAYAAEEDDADDDCGDNLERFWVEDVFLAYGRGPVLVESCVRMKKADQASIKLDKLGR